MDKTEKVAFFDFCETLADFQTADSYVDFVREVTGNSMMIKQEKIRRLLVQMRVLPLLEIFFKGKSLNKKIKLYQLKGLSKETLEKLAKQYYEERIKPHFIQPLINRLYELKQEGYTIGLVSGGYGIYLRYFVEEYELDFCLSSNVSFKKEKCTGMMEGPDCLNENKLKYLGLHYKKAPELSIAFSDSQTDLPLLQWVKIGVVVSRKKHQQWIDNYNFKEIIWD